MIFFHENAKRENEIFIFRRKGRLTSNEFYSRGIYFHKYRPLPQKIVYHKFNILKIGAFEISKNLFLSRKKDLFSVYFT